MNELQIFTNPEFGRVRTVIIDGEPWFVGKDVATALGYANPNEAIQDHVDDEDKLNSKSLSKLNSKSAGLNFGQRGVWLINEAGVYSLIFGSKLESAKSFKRWVTREVLPSIRKTGAYIPPKPVPELPAPRVATAKRILAQCAEIQAETIPDRPETKLKAMKTVKNLLKDNGLNAPSIVVDLAFHSEESDLDMVDFVFSYPKEAPTDYESYLASLLIPRLEG